MDSVVVVVDNIPRGLWCVQHATLHMLPTEDWEGGIWWGIILQLQLQHLR